MLFCVAMSAQQHPETLFIGKTGILVSKLAKQIYASIILKWTNEKLPIIFRR
jgi:hypothetical protein